MTLLRSVALSIDAVLAVTEAAVLNDVEAGRLRPLNVEGLPPLHSEKGAVSLRDRSPSPMAQRAIELIAAVARDVNSAPVGNAAP